MKDYNFLNLSAFEFENITRDILQKKLGVFIESFTTGKDDGIDLRAAKSKDSSIIIQAKRYSKYSDLKTSVKKEASNLIGKNIKRYILSTTVGLTPANKTEIKEIFKPFIKSTEDIIGKNDLNNLLGIYPEIEKQYSKLWLSSIEILQKVLHSKVYNQSNFELEEIKEVLKIYVQNDSFNEALDILKKNHYVIVSGIPGIGKTTLARMLVYKLLSKDFDEFVFLSDSVNDGYTYFEEDKKQVFLFDDFLGKNFLEIRPQVNEDNKIIRFIEKIKKSKNKLFILTTREYILKQAKSTFEGLNRPSLDLAKCTLDLSNYTKFIKAEILYNHLFFANVPNSHLLNLINTKKYFKIIEHKNYNPRIIETLVQKELWINCEANDFSNKIMDFFNNPQSVWLHAFENTISKESQITLLILATLGTPVLMEDLRDGINSFFIENASRYDTKIDSLKFQKVVKELENTFITTLMDSFGKVAIQFQNPSIHDFLIHYINEHQNISKDLINAFSYQDQFFNIFTLDKDYEKKYQNLKVIVNGELIDFFCNKIIIDFNLFKSSSIFRGNYKDSHKFKWYKRDASIYSFLYKIEQEFKVVSSKRISDFVRAEFEKNIEPKLTSYADRNAYIKLLSDLYEQTEELDSKNIVEKFALQVDSIDALQDFTKLKKIFNPVYSEYIEKDDFLEKVANIVDSEIEYTEVNNYENLISDIKDLESTYELSFDSEIQNLRTKHSEFMEEVDAKVDAEMDDYKYQEQEYTERIEQQEKEITNLFTSLLE